MTSVFNIPSPTTNPINPFLPPILAFLVSPTDSPDVKTPANFIATISSSRDPINALWQLWDAFFTTVVCTDPLPSRYAPHLALLNALHAHPPTEPKYAPPGSFKAHRLRWHTLADGRFHWSTELPDFHAQWTDAHNGLEAWRHLKGKLSSAEATMAMAALSDSSGGGSGGSNDACPDRAECYLRFCTFSAALLKESETGGMKGNPMQVFFACLGVLEQERPGGRERADPYSISPEQVWALDVRVAGAWMRDGAQSLWNADQQKLREVWAAAIDEPTDLWPKGGGLTRGRWQYWAARLQDLSTDNQRLDAETRAVVAEAAEVVKGLMNVTSLR